MSTSNRKAVVVGGLGVTGRAVIEHIDALPDWTAVGLSRRAPDFATEAPFVSVDLLDRADCEAKLASITDATDIVYAAFQPRPTWAELVEPNVTMLRNAVEVLERASPGLRHVCLIQGGKAYGAHLGPFRTPAKESDPRHMPPEFYYDQEDFLRARQADASWTWSALRPEATSGFAVANPMNLLMVIGVYAAMCREFGVPFRFPGKSGAYTALYQVTDARILARAILWSATEPRCAGEVFNITNGDYFRWQNLWPRLAQFFELEYDEPQTLPLAEFMADKGPAWDRIVARHGLQPYAYEDIVAWEFGDAVFASEFDNITSTIKARQYGFADCIDTEDMFIELFAQLQQRRILPPSQVSAPSVPAVA
jgi:nucleoside-diphosphate-sugar epimerase